MMIDVLENRVETGSISIQRLLASAGFSLTRLQPTSRFRRLSGGGWQSRVDFSDLDSGSAARVGDGEFHADFRWQVRLELVPQVGIAISRVGKTESEREEETASSQKVIPLDNQSFGLRHKWFEMRASLGDHSFQVPRVHRGWSIARWLPQCCDARSAA